jgi:hypothetical protein
MHSVEMYLSPSELSATMAEMRVWLDQHRFEPSYFFCQNNNAGVVVRVDFKIAVEAEAFAGRFSHHTGEGPTAGGQDQLYTVPSALPPSGVVG